MKVLKVLLSIVIGLVVTTAFGSSTAADRETIDPGTLSLEEFYRVKPFGGTTAREIKFSQSDRYVSFLWNSYDEMGNLLFKSSRNRSGFDLYVYDIKKAALTRVTSLEIMKQFDPPEDYEKFLKKRKQLEEEEKQLQEMFFAQRDYLENKDIDLGKFEKEELEKLKKELAEEKKKEQEKKKEDKKNEQDQSQQR